MLTTGEYNDSYKIKNTTTSSKPTSKAGEIPYYHADYNTAEEMSKRMYSNSSYVSSGLITGTQWDVMLNYISSETDKSTTNASDDTKYTDLKANCDWGNYKDINLKNCDGKYCTICSVADDENIVGSMTSLWQNNTEGTNKHNESNNWTLLTTGSTEQAKKKNLYDIAGNLWEWTGERGYDGYDTYTLYMIRGASFKNTLKTMPTCYRGYLPDTWANEGVGFRVTLYIK